MHRGPGAKIVINTLLYSFICSLPRVLQEQGVVREGRHGNAHLTQIVEILDDRGLPEQEAA